MRLLESYGDYISRSDVRDICVMIVDGRDMEMNVGILSDMYEDVGNDLKASVIRRGLDLGGRWYVRGLYRDAFERGVSDGIVCFGMGNKLRNWEDEPWSQYAVYVNGSDIFESGVEYRKNFRDRVDVKYMNLYVDVFSSVSSGMMERCRGMQMSVLQHVESSGDSPVGMSSEMTVLIRALDLDRGESYKVSVPFVNLRQFGAEALTKLLRVSGKWIGEVGGVRILVDKRLAYESEECVSKIKGSFVNKLLAMVKSASVRHFKFHMDFEDYEYLKRLEGME